MGLAIIVHGGAWDIPADLQADHVAGCRAAAEAGWAVLADGGSALDAVEAAVRVMEDHPVFDAGRGSHLNRDGEVELDAGMMDGRTLMAGAVASVKRIANPISLARRVLHDSEHVFLVGAGAERFAAEAGIPFCQPADLVIERERLLWEERRRMTDDRRPTTDDRRGPLARLIRSAPPIQSALSPSTRPATWPWATRPAARCTSTPAASATRRSSAAGCMRTTCSARPRAPAGASRS